MNNTECPIVDKFGRSLIVFVLTSMACHSDILLGLPNSLPVKLSELGFSKAIYIAIVQESMIVDYWLTFCIKRGPWGGKFDDLTCQIPMFPPPLPYRGRS